jgi:hypothetical protein
MQIFFVCNCTYAAKHWQVSIEMVNGFLVGHCSKYTAYENILFTVLNAKCFETE